MIYISSTGGIIFQIVSNNIKKEVDFFFQKRLLKKSFFAGCSKMPRCKAPEYPEE